MKSLAPLMFALAATAVQAEPASVTGGQTLRLSPAQVQAALDAAAENRAGLWPAFSFDESVPPAADGRPHGEVGAFVGSNGTRVIYGTTVMPLGQTGTLGLSFSTGRFPRWGY